MPISNGFTGDRSAHAHRTTLTNRIRRPQIITRAQQFQEDIRNKQRHVPFSKGTAGHRSPPTRPTAVVKQPNRSNTFTLPKKNEENSNKTTNALPRLKPAPPPPPKKKTLHPISTPFRPPAIKPTPPMAEQRRPVRFASEVNYAYPSASSARTNLPPAAPQRSMRVIHDNYSHSQHRNAYTDYPSSSVSVYPHTSFPPIRASSSLPPPQVIIRSKESYPRPPVPLPSYPPTTAPFMILPSPPMFLPSNYPYPLPPAPAPSTSIVNQASASTSSKVDSHPPTLILPPVQEKKNVTVQLQVANETEEPVVQVIRRPARQVVYVDEEDPPARQIIRRRRRRQPEVIYIDEEDPMDEEVIYVDEDGRQIEYIYDEPVRYRTYPRVRQTHATNVVYE